VLSAQLRSPRPGARPAAAATRHVIAVGLVATAVMVALLAAGQAIDFGVFNLRLRWLNTDTHLSVFGVVSLFAQVAAAAASAQRGAYAERQRWGWLTLGALLAVLVLIRGLTTYSSSVVGAPLACVFVLLFWLTWRDPGASRAVVWAGLILLMTSLLLHEVGPASDTSNASDYSWSYQVVTMIKHGAELGGWMLMATGIVAGLKGRLASSRPRR
jgi:hypothetical protein